MAPPAPALDRYRLAICLHVLRRSIKDDLPKVTLIHLAFCAMLDGSIQSLSISSPFDNVMTGERACKHFRQVDGK